MSSCVNVLRIVTFLLNFIFWSSGIIVLGLGIWLLFDPDASDFFTLHSTHPGYFRNIGWFLVVAGLCIIFVSCFGCFGAWKMNQCALIICCGFLILVFFLELAAAVTAFQKQDHVKHYVESSMYDTIRNRYSSEPAFRTAFDTIQENFECCGVRSYSDWLNAQFDVDPKTSLELNEEDAARIEHGIGASGGFKKNGFGTVPTSCCNKNGLSTYPIKCGESFDQAPLSTYASFINSKGCADAVYERVSNSLSFVVAVCVALCIVQLIGIVLSMTLCCCVNKTKK